MRRSLFLLALLVLATGCGRGSFIGSRLDNFTAYYNTFYNAEKSFDEGVKTIRQGAQSLPVDQNVYLPIFGSEERAAQTKPFDDAIKKSADVLREHADSKWVDDALLLIGKSYFYLQNYVGAEQKFREVMTLDSRLDDEARFWLARTLIAGEQFDEAAAHLQESLIREGRSKRWEPRLRLALGELYVRRSGWDDAARELEAGLTDVRDNDLAARAQLLLGQVYETLARYDDAVAAYDRVSTYNPFYELAYAAQVSAVRVEGLHGDPDEALRKLRRMERDGKNYANRAELAYLRGRVYQAMGRAEDALDTYDRLLYDSDANINAVRGRVHYALGILHRDLFLDYALAAAYFDTASSALRNVPSQSNRSRAGAGVGAAAAAQPASAPAAITDGEEQARIFGSFARVMGDVSRMDSLLYLGSLDEEAFQQVVLELRQRRAEELTAQRIALERQQAEQLFAGGFDERGDGGGGNRLGFNPNTNTGATTAQTGAAGFLFHKDPIRMQEGVAGFEQRWGRRPLVPNWRRLDAITGVGAAAAGPQGEAEGKATPGLAGVGLPEVDVSSVPRDVAAQEEMRARRAVARYELGNVLFLAMGRPDSAAVWYRKVIEEDSDEPVAQRAFYALAEVQRALRDTLAAEGLYRTILDRYPNSDFAGRARERLGITQAQITASDSLALAEDAYARAYDHWQRHAFQQSLDEMVEVAAHYRETDVAPRALFAAGTIYMEWAARDSLPLFEPLPLTVPDSLLKACGLLRVPTAGTASPAVPPAQPGAPLQQQAARPEPQAAPPEKDQAPDARGAMPRLLRQRSDTLALPADTLALPADTLALPADTLALPADSLALPSDTLGAGVDSLAQAGDAGADTTAAPPEPEPVRLTTLYDHLVDRYPRAPQAEQARRVLRALEERRKALEAPPDTAAAPVAALPDTAAAQPPADRATAAADSAAVQQRRNRLRGLLDERRAQGAERLKPPADTLAAAEPDEEPAARRPSPPADTLAAPADSARAEAVLPLTQPPAPPGLSAVDRAKGGWTVVVGSEKGEAQAALLARNFGYVFRDEGLPVEVFPAGLEEGVRYRVGVGLFATQEEAAAALERLASRLPKDAWIMKIPPAE